MNYSVMIIDDNEVDRYLLKRYLDKTGLDILIFEQPDGEDAIDFLQDYRLNTELYGDQFPPLWLFVDINMPKLDGWGFLDRIAELRTQQYLSSVTAAMFTSSDRQEDRLRAGQYEFVREYVVKGEIEHAQLHRILTTNQV